jgi:hypothetical protein
MRAPPEAVMQMKGHPLFDRVCTPRTKALAEHRAHRAAHETELKGGGDDRHGF